MKLKNWPQRCATMRKKIQTQRLVSFRAFLRLFVAIGLGHMSSSAFAAEPTSPPAAEPDRATLIATSDPEEAYEVADRILTIDHHSLLPDVIETAAASPRQEFSA